MSPMIYWLYMMGAISTFCLLDSTNRPKGKYNIWKSFVWALVWPLAIVIIILLVIPLLKEAYERARKTPR